MLPWKRSLLVIWFCHLSVDFFTGIWPAYKTLAGLDLTKAGLILGVSGFLGDGSQLFFGALADRALRKKLVALGLILACFASFLSFSSDYFILFLLMLGVYLGSGIFHPAAAGIVQNLVPSRKSFTIAVFASGGALGLSLSQLFYSYLYTTSSFHSLLLIFLPFTALFFLKGGSYPENLEPKKPFAIRNLIKPFKEGRNKKAFTFLYFAQLCQQSVTYGFIFFLPDILRCQGQNPLICYGLGHCMLIIGSGVMLIPMGILADYLGQKRVLILLGTFSTFFFYLFLFKGQEANIGVVLILFFLGATIGSFNPIGVSLGNRLITNRASSVSAILMGGVWCFSHVIGSGIGGLMTKLFSENEVIYAMAVLGLLYPLCIVFISFIPSAKLLVLDDKDTLEPVKIPVLNSLKIRDDN